MISKKRNIPSRNELLQIPSRIPHDGKEVPQTFEQPRKGETELTQFHMDLAASIQLVTEEMF